MSQFSRSRQSNRFDDGFRSIILLQVSIVIIEALAALVALALVVTHFRNGGEWLDIMLLAKAVAPNIIATILVALVFGGVMLKFVKNF